MVESHGTILQSDQIGLPTLLSAPSIKKVLNALPVVVWQTDPTGRCVYFNQAWVDFIGSAAACSRGVGWASAIHPDDRERVIAACEVGHLRGEPYRVSYRLRRLDGEYRWVVDLAQPFRDEEGTLNGFVGTLQDGTEQVQAQEKEHRHSEMMRQAGRLAKIGAWELEIGSSGPLWSEEVYRIHEVQIGVPIGLDQALQFYTAESQPVISAAVERGMRDGTGWDLKLQIRTAKGNLRWVRAIGIGEFRDGACVRVFGTFQDTTEEVTRGAERAALEVRLSEAQRMESLGTLAGGIAHDFNNILAALMGILGVMELKAPSGGDFPRYIQSAQQACERARELIAQILRFSRRDPGKREIVDLVELINDGLVLLRAALPVGIEIQFAVEIKSGTAHALLYRSQFHQVLMNLVTNSAQAFPQGQGTIRIALREEPVVGQESGGSFLRLEVHDSGPGIPKAIQGRVFDPFFTTKEPGKGTGLGLSVVHGIVAAHGGSVSVGDSPLGGALLSVQLPGIQGAAVANEPEGKQKVEPGSERIWVVEDEVALGEVTQELLELSGYKARFWSDPKAVLAHAQGVSEGPDLCVIDYTMPSLTGLTLVRQLRALSITSPVIIVSGYVDQELEQARAQGEISAILQKPVQGAELTAAIRQVLRALA